MDEQAARALMELLPGRRRRRWMLFLINHPEVEEPGFVGVVQLNVRTDGNFGMAHINRSNSWDLELETT